MKIGGLSGLGGAPGETFEGVRERYEGFGIPRVVVEFNGAPFKDGGNKAVLSSVSVELSSGFEASVARLRIYNAYDSGAGVFRFDDMKKSLQLGRSMSISLGYYSSVCLVFVGFVAEVYFGVEEGDMPYIDVVGMDVKGVMMAGSYSTQLKALSYGEAVREVLNRTNYGKLKSSGGMAGIEVSDTPDKKTGKQDSSAERVEMVAESDYEFVVKAARKFNYEFFVEKGTVIFRKAKEGASTLMALKVGQGVTAFEIGYGITGLVAEVEARAMDPGSGKLISAKKKMPTAISSGSSAKGIIAKSKRIYIDPTITSREEADARAESIVEEMSYRLGSFECTCIGIPELLPGHYIKFDGVGAPVANTFYITSVVHELDEERGYTTRLTGKAAEVIK